MEEQKVVPLQPRPCPSPLLVDSSVGPKYLETRRSRSRTRPDICPSG